MKYLLVEPNVKGITPNLALMKYARWCENKGYKFQYVKGNVDPGFIPDYILISCIFSFYSKKYEETIDYYLKKYPKAQIKVGGVFPTLTPEWFDKPKWKGNIMEDSRLEVFQGMNHEIEELTPKYNINVIYQNPFIPGPLPDPNEPKKKGRKRVNPEYQNDKIVLYSSRGCPNKCGYCAVPILEGKMIPFKSIKETLDTAIKEIPNAKSVVLYDNNFTSHKYFDNIVNELIDFGMPVDIHGLHVSSFTEHQAEMFAKLKWGSQNTKGTAYMRFSFDWLKYYKHIDRALGFTTKHNVKAGFFCYLLFNWEDSPMDFWERIVLAQKLTEKHGKTIFLFPQRYEPFMALTRNGYIGPKWDDELVRGLVRLYTYIHGFISTTKTRNVFNWIGHTPEEFFQRARNMANTKYKLTKKTTPAPSLESLLKTIEK